MIRIANERDLASAAQIKGSEESAKAAAKNDDARFCFCIDRALSSIKMVADNRQQPNQVRFSLVGATQSQR